MLKLLHKTQKKNGKWYGLYQCSCGQQKEIRISAVDSGNTKSCGCHRRIVAKQNAKKAIKHGQSGTYLYTFWQSHVKYNCVWKSFNEFYEWIKDLWEPGLVLLDNNGYYDTNCKLVTSDISKKIHTQQTSLKKYGTEHPTQAQCVKEKIIKTNLVKYGVSNPSKTDVVKQHTIENNKKKYGVDYPQQLSEYRQKQKQHTINTVGYDSKQWAKHIGIARSTFNMWVRQYGFDIAINMTKKTSSIEIKLQHILDSLNIQYSTHKKIGKFFPDIIAGNIIIEADGLYWHSDAVNDDKYYHRTKMLEYEKYGYRSLFFRENEIIKQSHILSSIIQNSFQQSDKIFARKCKIVELDLTTRKQFFIQNHLMQAGKGKCYALQYKDNIVCALQFTNRHGNIDISRFCNKLNTTVIGGYSKLIKNIIRKEKCSSIQTFVDRRYGIGNYLLNLGFEKVSEHLSFVWIKNNEVKHRLQFRGNSGYEYGYNKLWDCGQAKYILKNPQ